MNKNVFMVTISVILAALMLTGCETAKGFKKGAGTAAAGVGITAVGVGGAVVEAGKGAGKDAVNTYQNINDADEWMRKNLW